MEQDYMEELRAEAQRDTISEAPKPQSHIWGTPQAPAVKPETAPAEATTNIFSKPKEETQDSPQQIIKDLHNAAIVHQVREDEETKEKFLEQAKRSVDNELESLNQENIAHLQKTTYDANADACKNYGVEESVPLWEIRLMKAGSAFWFVIYWIFASLTICPISVFAKGIRAFIKKTWLAVAVAVIAYLIIAVGIPVIIAWANTRIK